MTCQCAISPLAEQQNKRDENSGAASESLADEVKRLRKMGVLLQQQNEA